MKLDRRSVKQRFAVGAVAIVIALALMAVSFYMAGRRAGQTPQVVEGTAQVLASNQVVMDPSGDQFPGGTGAFSVSGTWWTAAGVTHSGDTPPSCLTPGNRPRLRLAVLRVRATEHSGPERWVVTHVECLA